ncbi:MAG: pyruvate dehydrogenase complex dihydrolipoamide acetyltransferase [Chitinophagales bacterium]
MAEVIRMPRMSDTMTEGTFVEWHKKVGDTVKSGDILAEVETDKATMELENYVKGTLLYIGVEKGKSAQVDQVIAIVGAPGEDFQALLNDSGKTAAPVEKKEEKAPEAEPKAEVKTEVKEAAKVETKTEEKPETKTEAPVAKENTEDGRIKASPLAKKIAQDKGISLDAVSGSGPEGRIIKKDVEEFVPQTKETAKTEKPVIQIPQIVGEEGYDETPVSQMRKVIAARLSQSKFTAPHFYLTISVDMDNAIAARKSLNEVSPVKISFNDLVVKASAMALRRNPAVNSSWLGDTIRTNKHIHIGVAVAINDGLVVPVIRFADNKSLSQISAETGDLAERAKNRKLQPADWEGNTFTISNLGMMGIEEFTAIINPPDACILAVGGIQQVPVVKNGQVVPGNVMKLTMSCDHRVVDGAVGAKFLQTLKQYLEDPVRMLA